MLVIIPCLGFSSSFVITNSQFPNFILFFVFCSPDHHRSHSRYDLTTSSSSVNHERSTHGPSSVYKSSKGDRSRHSYSSSSHHHNYRSSEYYHTANSHSYHNDVGEHTYDDEMPVKKKPRLTVDVSRKASSQFDTPNSADSVISSSNFTTGSATPSIANESPAASPPPVCSCVCVCVRY